jgi:LysM repeat protein
MKTQRALLLSTIGLLIALSLVVGCAPQRKVLPDSEETPAGDSQASSGDESAPGMSDLQKTAQANSATATAAAASEAVDGEGTTPTESPPTEPPPAPTTLPTPVEPTSAVVATVAPTEPAPTATTEPSAGTGEETTYVVQRGDTLFSIARRYGTTVQAIAARNGIANPSLISAGQTLVIPASGTSPSTGGQTYVVQRGDNLFRIALRHNMSYVDLAQYNGISDPSRIYVGQVIRIPPQ